MDKEYIIADAIYEYLTDAFERDDECFAALFSKEDAEETADSLYELSLQYLREKNIPPYIYIVKKENALYMPPYLVCFKKPDVGEIIETISLDNFKCDAITC
jgi:hypothetical protein